MIDVTDDWLLVPTSRTHTHTHRQKTGREHPGGVFSFNENGGCVSVFGVMSGMSERFPDTGA